MAPFIDSDDPLQIEGTRAPLVGLPFYRYKGLRAHLTEGVTLHVRRQPDNEKDANALAVFVRHTDLFGVGTNADTTLDDGYALADEYMLGHVAGDVAALISPLLDNLGMDEILARLNSSEFPRGARSLVLVLGKPGATPEGRRARKTPKGAGVRIGVWI